MGFVSGLDLGQAGDYTAWAVAEQSEGPHPTRPGERAWRYAVRHLQRWPLGTPYPQIVEAVTDARRKRLPDAPMAVDATGVGRAVVDLFRRSPVPGRLVSVTITAGQRSRQEAGEWHVPKKELVGVMQSLLQTRRLDVAAALPEAQVLRRELANFRVKVTTAANETFGAWREGQHDDLVLAVALACWWGERQRCGGGPGVHLPAPSQRTLTGPLPSRF